MPKARMKEFSMQPSLTRLNSRLVSSGLNEAGLGAGMAFRSQFPAPIRPGHAITKGGIRGPVAGAQTAEKAAQLRACKENRGLRARRPLKYDRARPPRMKKSLLARS